jgi:glucokinase
MLASEALSMNDGLYIGIDLGGTNIKFALIDGSGSLLERETVPTGGDEGYEAVLQRMIGGAESLVDLARARGNVYSIGVAVPGGVDMETGHTKFLPNLPGDWPDIPVAPRIQEALGLPTFIINDVRAFTVAELALGSARGVTTALCYAIGTGIGGGIVAHGRVNMGLDGAGGELGHMIVDPNGPVCGCGNRGCIEAYAAGPALIAEANRRIVTGATTMLREMIEEDLNRMTPRHVEEAAEQGDAVARDVLDYAGYHFGLGVAGAIAALAPEVIVLGGGVVQSRGYYWQQIEASARAHSHLVDIDRIEFRPAALGYEAGVIGAALHGMQQFHPEVLGVMDVQSNRS